MSKETICDICGGQCSKRKNPGKTGLPVIYKIYEALGGGNFGYARQDLCQECRANMECLLEQFAKSDLSPLKIEGLIRESVELNDLNSGPESDQGGDAR